MKPYKKILLGRSRELRKNATGSERILWQRLKGKKIKGLSFTRQKPLGNYIVDFYCPKAKLIIEIDGSQHYQEKNKEYDNNRDKYLRSLDLKVIRFNILEIYNNLDGVIDRIYLELENIK